MEQPKTTPSPREAVLQLLRSYKRDGTPGQKAEARLLLSCLIDKGALPLRVAVMQFLRVHARKGTPEQKAEALLLFNSLSVTAEARANLGLSRDVIAIIKDLSNAVRQQEIQRQATVAVAPGRDSHAAESCAEINQSAHVSEFPQPATPTIRQLQRKFPVGLTAPKLAPLIGVSGRAIAKRIHDGKLPYADHGLRKHLVQWPVIDLVTRYGLSGVERMVLAGKL